MKIGFDLGPLMEQFTAMADAPKDHASAPVVDCKDGFHCTVMAVIGDRCLVRYISDSHQRKLSSSVVREQEGSKQSQYRSQSIACPE
jgi:hypothetical protein